jgi:hypothetical protein
MSPINTRLPGHELQYEGQPYTAKGYKIMGLQGSTGGVGRAKCSCGELSDNLPSGTQRKAWHREHKKTIREAQA